MVYLGATLSADGRVKTELSKKFGQAWADFSKLLRFWNHCSVSIRRKVQIFQSVITSRLLYGLSSAWLNAAERRRLDGFQARCLRKILRIPPPFLSRVSNRTVLQRSEQSPYATQLLRQQLLLFGKVARADDTDVLRKASFFAGSLRPVLDRYVRNVGRPRNEWIKMVLKSAVEMVGSIDGVEGCVSDAGQWKEKVYDFTSVAAAPVL